jgi:hypothetical protein
LAAGDDENVASRTLLFINWDWEPVGDRKRLGCASAGHRHRGGRDLSSMSGILADSSYRLLPA